MRPFRNNRQIIKQMNDLEKRRKKQVHRHDVKKADKLYKTYYLEPWQQCQDQGDEDGTVLLSSGVVKVSMYDALTDYEKYARSDTLNDKAAAVFLTGFAGKTSCDPQTWYEDDWDDYVSVIRAALTMCLGSLEATSLRYVDLLNDLNSAFKEVFPKEWENFMAGKLISPFELELLEHYDIPVEHHYLFWSLLKYGSDPVAAEFVLDVITRVYPELTDLKAGFLETYSPFFYRDNQGSPERNGIARAMYLRFLLEDPLFLMAPDSLTAPICQFASDMGRSRFSPQTSRTSGLDDLFRFFGQW